MTRNVAFMDNNLHLTGAFSQVFINALTDRGDTSGVFLVRKTAVENNQVKIGSAPRVQMALFRKNELSPNGTVLDVEFYSHVSSSPESQSASSGC